MIHETQKVTIKQQELTIRTEEGIVMKTWKKDIIETTAMGVVSIVVKGAIKFIFHK